MINRTEKAFTTSNLQYDKLWLKDNHYIIALNKHYNEDMYKDANILIDLFALQLMKEIAYYISEGYPHDHDMETSVLRYTSIIQELGIDFNLFVLLAGEDYINSEDFTYEFEDCSKNEVNILGYLLDKNYHKIVKILRTHYKDEQKLLLTIIEPFFPAYETRVQEITTLEDMCAYQEVVAMHSWANDGFDINGDQ